MKRSLIVALTAASLFGLAGCGEYGQNSGTTGRDTTGAEVLNMPAHFANVARKCDGPNMVYSTQIDSSAGGDISVVPNDPRCKGK